MSRAKPRARRAYATVNRVEVAMPECPPSGGHSGEAFTDHRQGQAPARAAGSGVVPPASNTGAHLTFHWIRGGFSSDVNDVLELVQDLTSAGYSETHDWGRFFYRKHHEFIAGLRVYYDPATSNMPSVLVDAPGEACDFLGLDRLRTLFCNADLARMDIAFDHAPFSPEEMAQYVRKGNIRCKSKSRHYIEDLGDEPDGNTLTLGSRSSHRFLRIYDGRGSTRVELELKGRYARAAKDILLSSPDTIPELALGAIRDFVDFVDTAVDQNVSRAPLVGAWANFVGAVTRTRLHVGGNPAPSAERVRHFIEHQVAATLYTYIRLGHDIADLLVMGRDRLKARHRSIIASALAIP